MSCLWTSDSILLKNLLMFLVLRFRAIGFVCDTMGGRKGGYYHHACNEAEGEANVLNAYGGKAPAPNANCMRTVGYARNQYLMRPRSAVNSAEPVHLYRAE